MLCVKFSLGRPSRGSAETCTGPYGVNDDQDQGRRERRYDKGRHHRLLSMRGVSQAAVLCRAALKGRGCTDSPVWVIKRDQGSGEVGENTAERWQEPLRGAGRAEPFIARSRCLVGWWEFSAWLFRPVCKRCSTEGMPVGDAVGAKLVRDQHPRHATLLFRQLGQELLGVKA